MRRLVPFQNVWFLDSLFDSMEKKRFKMSIQISDTSARIQYTATGGQTVFAVPFEFFRF